MSLPLPEGRKRRVWPWVVGGLTVLLTLGLLTGVSFGHYSVKRSFPQTSGVIELA